MRCSTGTISSLDEAPDLLAQPGELRREGETRERRHWSIRSRLWSSRVTGTICHPSNRTRKPWPESAEPPRRHRRRGQSRAARADGPCSDLGRPFGCSAGLAWRVRYSTRPNLPPHLLTITAPCPGLPSPCPRVVTSRVPERLVPLQPRPHVRQVDDVEALRRAKRFVARQLHRGDQVDATQDELAVRGAPEVVELVSGHAEPVEGAVPRPREPCDAAPLAVKHERAAHHAIAEPQ